MGLTYRISIPRRCDWKAYNAVIPPHSGEYFNTSKVRLEEDARGAAMPFHRISIPRRCDWKLHGDEHWVSRCAHFNTSKVRLEETSGGGGNGSGEKFQYLEGAIGRLSFHHGGAGPDRISIPRRCDWKTTSEPALHVIKDISIPRRCDWKAAPRS